MKSVAFYEIGGPVCKIITWPDTTTGASMAAHPGINVTEEKFVGNPHGVFKQQSSERRFFVRKCFYYQNTPNMI